MSQTKQFHQAPLNGAYVSVPPQQPYYQRRSKGRCSTFAKVILAIAVILGIAVLIFWLALRPTKLKFYVASADLKQFDLNTNSSNLNYNLELTMTARNPNKRVGVYYDGLDATASYKGERFGWVTLPEFYHGHKNTTTLKPIFRGQSVMVRLNRFETENFNQEKKSGVFFIDVKLYARIRYKVGALKTERVKSEIECHLRIPLALNGTSAQGFESNECDFKP